MLTATVRKDLLEKGDRPPTSESWLPMELMDSKFTVIQPQEIEDDEFNIVVKTKDSVGNFRSFLVSSVDFDFHGHNLTKAAFGFNFSDIRERIPELIEYHTNLPLEVTDEQCSAILDEMVESCDMEMGVSWNSLEEAIVEVLEREEQEL